MEENQTHNYQNQQNRHGLIWLLYFFFLIIMHHILSV